MQRYGNYKKIKRSLLKGGLVFASRRYGKTLALIEIMYENPRAVVVTCNANMKELIDTSYFEKYGTKPVVVQRNSFSSRTIERVLTAERADRYSITNNPDFDVYVDEWFWANYRGHFKAAVTSAPMRVDIIKPSKKEREYIKKTVGKQYPTLVEFCIYEE